MCVNGLIHDNQQAHIPPLHDVVLPDPIMSIWPCQVAHCKDSADGLKIVSYIEEESCDTMAYITKVFVSSDDLPTYIT
jgi:hypothetical protein